jgi:VanZ family protein
MRGRPGLFKRSSLLLYMHSNSRLPGTQVEMSGPEPDSLSVQPEWLRLLWAYGPLVVWLGVIFLASTDVFSASNTSRILVPILKWFDPNISSRGIAKAHYLIRKAAHFTEYAILALFAARAFRWTRRLGFYRHWVLWALALVAIYSLTDEYHQSFVSSRTSSIYDSAIDTAGGLAGLFIAWMWSKYHQRCAR